MIKSDSNFDPNKKLYNWLLAVCFIISGMGIILSEDRSGMFILLMGIFLLPSTNKLLKRFLKFEIIGKLKFILIIVSLILFAYFSEPADVTQQKISEAWKEIQSMSNNRFGDKEESDNEVLKNYFKVERVVDGDTIELENGDKVRYIGINAPESVKIGSPKECFGESASIKNEELVLGKRVRLEKDDSDRDQFDRLLRYVYLEDGTFVNLELVRYGYAYSIRYEPDVFHQEKFNHAQEEAKINKRGVWVECDHESYLGN